MTQRQLEGLFDRRRNIYSIIIDVKMEQTEVDKRKFEDMVIGTYYFQLQITEAYNLICLFKRMEFIISYKLKVQEMNQFRVFKLVIHMMEFYLVALTWFYFYSVP